MNHLVAFIVDESKWLTLSMGLALAAAALLLYRVRSPNVSVQRRVSAAMSLFFGVTIGTMAFGHLLAVTTKLFTRTLEGSTLTFYLIGLALAVPSWWLVYHTREMVTSGVENGQGARTLRLNAWLSLTLVVLGLHNLPLAAPGFLNIGYHLHTRRVIGWTLVGAAVVVNVGLFIGSLIFLASGQSFEEFRGLP